MFRFIEYTLEANDLQSIALPQTVLSVTNPTRTLKLNGRLGNNADNKAILSANGFSYFVSLTATGDLSGINFTITGYHNSKLVNLTTAGPNNTVKNDNTVLFDSIIAVTSSADIPLGKTIAIGTVANILNTQTTVYSLPIMIDSPYMKGINSTIAVSETPSSANFNSYYNVYGSLKNIVNNKKTMSEMIGNELIKLTPNSLTTINPTFNISQPFRYCVLEVITNLNAVPPITILRFSQG